ncbi:O-methylsterigmatocystin oxidoreductase [Mycena venus]|uniref:O-methylsterigmatocystin oxidoreductase n=1 Tax=Mycena venus TaxID=2733690 RepID=A0A8H6XLD8_9AGAR|nr:O-methylsterigmatocystin oxidoreductase [Mycena venus]
MESAPTFNPHSTIGAYQIGVLISYILFGVTTTQAYIYYSRFPDDSRKLKALIAVVWFGELGHAICIGHTLYAFTILDYGHSERLFGPAPKSLETSILFGSITTTSVQVFFAFRIYKFSKKLQIPIVCWTLSFVRQLAALTIFVTALRPIPVATYDLKWRWLFLTYWSVRFLFLQFSAGP